MSRRDPRRTSYRVNPASRAGLSMANAGVEGAVRSVCSSVFSPPRVTACPSPRGRRPSAPHRAGIDARTSTLLPRRTCSSSRKPAFACPQPPRVSSRSGAKSLMKVEPYDGAKETKPGTPQRNQSAGQCRRRVLARTFGRQDRTPPFLQISDIREQWRRRCMVAMFAAWMSRGGSRYRDVSPSRGRRGKARAAEQDCTVQSRSIAERRYPLTAPVG